MPLFSYGCPECSHVTEELFFRRSEITEVIACENCESEAYKLTVCNVTVIGADSLYLEQMSKAHFTKQELRQGKSFKSHRELSNFEDSKKMRRLSPGTPEYRAIHESQMDEDRMYKRIKRDSGAKGLAEHFTKNDIQSKLGWSDQRYKTWKDKTDGHKNTYDPKSDAGNVGKPA